MAEKVSIDDYEGSFNIRKMTPTLVKRWFQAADKGNIKELMQAAAHILAKDWDLSPYLSLRCNAPSLRKWEIAGGKEGIAQRVENQLRNIMPDREEGLLNFRKLIKESGKSAYFGHVVFKVEYVDEERKIIKGFKPYNPATFKIDMQKRCLTYSTKDEKDKIVPSSHYYQCVPFVNPQTEALCRISLILHLLKNIPAWEWASYVEAFATPISQQ